MSLKVITPPAVEPVSVEEVKLHTHISHSVEDSLLSTWIKSARELAEGFQRRAFITQTLEISFDSYPEMPISIPRPPLVSVSSVKYYDCENNENTIELGSLIIDIDHEPGRLCWAYDKTWPSVTLRPMNCLKIRYIAGYGDLADKVPAAVKDAIMLYCAFRNENRAAEIDSAPKQFFDLLRPDRMYL